MQKIQCVLGFGILAAGAGLAFAGDLPSPEPAGLSGRGQFFLLAAMGVSAAAVGVSAADNKGETLSRPVRTGFLYDEIYLRHHTGAGHPERPERLTAIVERLKQKGLLAELLSLKPVAASTNWLTTVHTAEYVARVRQSCRAGIGYVDTPDAPASTDSYEVALAAVGGVQSAIDAVMAGKIKNAFCAIRPPGHHALRDGAMGFCLFNNVAIAARYIQQQYKLPKVLIVDWDVHHGNGTQAAFYEDPTVFYFSTHQSPFYPGIGQRRRKRAGQGTGVYLQCAPAGRVAATRSTGGPSRRSSNPLRPPSGRISCCSPQASTPPKETCWAK